MKKPTLRFRQVFEHPTHFKVTKPLGNPLIIAKKGLSPLTQSRLRKFAVGGDVTAPVEASEGGIGAPEEMAGIELERELAKPEAERDQQYIAQLQKMTAPPSAPAPEYKSRAIPSTREPAAEEAPVAAKSADVVPVAETAPTAPAAQPPVTVNVLTPQQPEAAPKVAVAAPPVIPAEAPAAVVAPAPAPVPAVAPVVAAAPAAIAPAPAVTPPIKVEAAPAAPPAAAVIPPAMRTEPQSITVENLQKLMKDNPGKTPRQLATELIKASLPPTGVSQELIAKSVDAIKGMASDEMFNEGMATQLRGLVNQANSEARLAQETSEIADRAVADRLVAAEKNKQSLDALARRKDALEAAVSGGFKPESFLGRMDTVPAIASVFSMFVGAIAAGIAKTPNYAMKAFDDAVNRDLDAQKKRYDSIYNQYVRALNDYDAAEKLTKADLSDLAALQIKAISARQDLSKLGPAADIMIGKLQMDAAEKRSQVAEAQYKADVAKSDAQYANLLNKARADHLNRMGTGVGTAAGARAATAEKNYELRLRKFELEQERRENSSEFTVPNPSDPDQLIIIKTRDVADGRAARKETLQRVTALSRVEELDNILKSKRTTKQALLPDEVARVRILVNEITENYPSLAKGTTQLVTQAQAKLLKDSVDDAVSIPYVKWGNFSGMTGAAIQKLREEGSRLLKVSVNSYARPEDPGASQFNALFTKKGFSGRVGELPARPQVVPAGKVKVKDSAGKVFMAPAANLPKLLKAGYVEVK